VAGTARHLCWASPAAVASAQALGEAASVCCAGVQLDRAENSNVEVGRPWHTSAARPSRMPAQNGGDPAGTARTSLRWCFRASRRDVEMKFRVIPGYEGVNRRRAMEKGEVRGHPAAVVSNQEGAAEWMREKDLNLLCGSAARHPESRRGDGC